MWFLKRKPEAMAVEVANDISIHATYGCNRFKEIVGVLTSRSLEIEWLLIGYMEFNIFLLHVTDKLASSYYSNANRREIINKTVDSVKQNFCNTQIFDRIVSDKGDFFEKYFQEAFYAYPHQSSIYGNDDNNVAMYFSQRLMDLFLKDEIEAQRIFVQNITYEMLEPYIKEYLALKSVCQLLKK